MFFRKEKTVWCPVCHEKMIRVDHSIVPHHAIREFARMNRWDMLSVNGWFHCPGCKVHIHKPTVDKHRK